jgi:hypothetical protein
MPGVPSGLAPVQTARIELLKVLKEALNKPKELFRIESKAR